MASLISAGRAPQCLSCMRRVTASFGDAWLAPARQQVRGKKKLAKATTIKVRLRTDVPRYGPEGAIIRLTSGRMRNDFYPRQLADYVTDAQLKELGLENALAERDSAFGTAQKKMRERLVEVEAPAPITRAPAPVTVDLLKPARAMELLSKLLPANIDFYRTPIAPAPVQKVSPSIPASSRLSEAALKGSDPSGPEQKSIYGSVTTADIASNIKALLAEDEVGARIVLAPEEISFVEEGEEHDRVKHLGIFEIDIWLKGAPDAIRRTIKINAQD